MSISLCIYWDVQAYRKNHLVRLTPILTQGRTTTLSVRIGVDASCCLACIHQPANIDSVHLNSDCLCYVLICYIRLCCAVLCYVVLYHDAWSCAVLRYFMFWLTNHESTIANLENPDSNICWFRQSFIKPVLIQEILNQMLFKLETSELTMFRFRKSWFQFVFI